MMLTLLVVLSHYRINMKRHSLMLCLQSLMFMTLNLLLLEITEKFLHPNGKEGSVSDVRTVIFDRAKDVKSEMKKVCFYVGDEIYKEYGIPKDAFCTMPVSPQKDGARFRCWRFVTGGVGEAKGVSVTGKNGAREVLASQGAPYQASQDTKLIAVFDK